MSRVFPVIDLFAGPGGLGEGFSSVRDVRGGKVFEIGASVEKDPSAHATLSLRSTFRYLQKDAAFEQYSEFIQGNLSHQEFLEDPLISPAASEAKEEAKLAELGKSDPASIDRWIKAAIGNRKDWVLIGGPPCQAYSLAGRSRRTNDGAFEEDEKHFLYKEYLRIIRKFEPAVFVMENVKGLLSSTHGGSPIFSRITDDLSRPSKGLDYEIRSFVCRPEPAGHKPSDYVIRSELYGIPQMRHRVILLGVRRDYANRPHSLLERSAREVPVGGMLHGLPRIRSKLSKRQDSFEAWLRVISQTPHKLTGWRNGSRNEIEQAIAAAISRVSECQLEDMAPTTKGKGIGPQVPADLSAWIRYSAPSRPCQHVARGHMESDLQRYLFAAAYAQVIGLSPKLRDFPEKLLPSHANARDDDVPFGDRFRVQMSGRPATTIVSHISKDGHYYIHPDSSQCRSLTVREAARLQTFPDNYYFMGNRTQQYAQVGNAVPPFLAMKLGRIVAGILN